MSECVNGQHKKVYAEHLLMSNPPQQPWICSECGEKGVDQEVYKIITYADVIKKFSGK